MAFNIDFNQIKQQVENNSNQKSIFETDNSNNLSRESIFNNSDDQTQSRFNINLKDIAESEEVSEFINYLQVEDSVFENLVGALGTGLIYEMVYDDQFITEAKARKKKVVRSGKIVDKIVCPPGFKAKGESCEKMSTSDAKAFARRATKAAKTRGRRKSTSSIKSRQRSMLVRNKNKSKVDRMM